MRDILFRGKRVDNGEWVEGSLVNNIFFRPESNRPRPIPYIIDPYEYEEYNCMEDIGELAVEVIPETVGQYIGQKDKNGKKIFEGDIISTDLARDFLVVEFNGGAFVFNCNDGDKDYYDHINASYELKNEYGYGEIIGNIHDNPELLS